MKKLIFSLLPRAWQRRFILHRTGFKVTDVKVSPSTRFRMCIMPKTTTWDARLGREYGHEPQITKFYEQSLKENDIVFDVGAQMGYFPCLISAISPKVKVFAFEANWFTHSFLLRNKVMNDPGDKWSVYNYFISDTDKSEKGETYRTINTIVSSQKIVPTIFQMDVDGEEHRILRGAGTLLNNGVTEFLIEVHPKDLKDRGISVQEFLGYFNPEKFVFRYLPDLRSNSSVWVDDIARVDLSEEFYLYAAPPSKCRINGDQS